MPGLRDEVPVRLEVEDNLKLEHPNFHVEREPTRGRHSTRTARGASAGGTRKE